MFRIAFLNPVIPGNSGNAIRTAATTGSEIHLIGPLGFDLDDAKLRRAGLDYHDLAALTVHEDMDAAWQVFAGARIFAFTGKATVNFADVRYERGDVLLFGTEPTGLPTEVLADPRVTERVRIPMLPGLRSLNLSNAAAVAVYEGWRQHGYLGS